MTAAFIAALAVALLALGALAVSARRAAGSASSDRRAIDDLSAELEEVRQKLDRALTEAADAQAAADLARADSEAARSAAKDAEKSRAEAEQRAQTFQAEILRAEALAAERRVAAATTPGTGAALWQLERLRCEREWSEVVGPGVPLPVEWDETLGAVLATEMAIVREVIGTPGQVVSPESVALYDLPQAAATVRLGVELIRALARSGEEMSVTVSADAVVVDQRVLGPTHSDGLRRVRDVASSAGSEIAVEEGDQRLLARLGLPLRTPGSEGGPR